VVKAGRSAQWRNSASYVALTHHRESVHVFAARATVKDLAAMAESMARVDNKRATGQGQHRRSHSPAPHPRYAAFIHCDRAMIEY
jgi:hypothetical protein